MRVLLVEDDESIREVLKMVLEVERPLASQGSTLVVDTAATGTEALERAKETRPDLVLLDLTLDGEDGFEVFKSLRALDGCAALRVVALTAHNFSDIELRAIAEGFSGFVTKPIDFERALFPLMRRLFLEDQVA